MNRDERRRITEAVIGILSIYEHPLGETDLGDFCLGDAEVLEQVADNIRKHYEEHKRGI